MGIGKMYPNEPIVLLSVSLKSDEDAQSLTSSRSRISPRTVLHLYSGRLSLSNIRFLVEDQDLACEDLHIFLKVLRN